MMNKKLRVAFFSGPVEYSVCLANGLSEFCDVTFFYSNLFVSQRDKTILNVLDKSIKQVPITNFRIRDFRNVFQYFSIARQLHDFDVVHIQIGDFWLNSMRFLFSKVPIICTVHDPYQHPGLKFTSTLFQDYTQNLCIKQSRKIIVHGQKMKDALLKRYPNLKSKDVLIAYHGEFSFYQHFKDLSHPRIPKDPAFKRILFFGSVRRNKGLDILIKAEPLISKEYRDYKICIAGKFEGDKVYYEDLISDKRKYEIFDEFIPISDVSNFFENSDIVVLPYISGTQSGVLALAFGFGKPTIATQVGSIPEVLEHGINGVLVPPSNEEELAQAIIGLLNNDVKRAKLAQKAKQMADTLLGWDSIARQTHDIYLEVVN